MKIHKNRYRYLPLIIPLLSVGFAILIVDSYLKLQMSKHYQNEIATNNPLVVPTQDITKTMTKDELQKHDGSDTQLPIYISYDGIVYDVTSGEKFYGKGKTYNFLAGKDVTKEINLVGLGNTIKNKYPVVARLVD